MLGKDMTVECLMSGTKIVGGESVPEPVERLPLAGVRKICFFEESLRPTGALGSGRGALEFTRAPEVFISGYMDADKLRHCFKISSE
jgi:hypothetical protein